jgi:hypothetical protein
METRPIPNPGAGEVLIRVEASGSAAPSCSPDRAVHPTYGFGACSVSKRSAWLGIEGTSMIGKSQGETEIPLDSVEWVLRAGG